MDSLSSMMLQCWKGDANIAHPLTNARLVRSRHLERSIPLTVCCGPNNLLTLVLMQSASFLLRIFQLPEEKKRKIYNCQHVTHNSPERARSVYRKPRTCRSGSHERSVSFFTNIKSKIRSLNIQFSERICDFFYTRALTMFIISGIFFVYY